MRLMKLTFGLLRRRLVARRAGRAARAPHCEPAAFSAPAGGWKTTMSPTLRVAEALSDAVDEHALADLERRHHRLARDPVGLDRRTPGSPSARPSATATISDQLEQRAPGGLLVAGGLVGLRGLLTPCRRRAPSPAAAASAVGSAAASAGASASASAASLGLGVGVGAVLGRSRRLRRASSPRGPTSTSASAASASAAISLAVEQARLDELLGADVAALADARPLADAIAQVVELGAPHVTAGGDLDLLDLRRVDRERALDADAERLLAHREGLTRRRGPGA